IAVSAIIALFAVALGTAYLISGGQSTPQRTSALGGTLLDGRQAPTFKLHDQTGALVTLDSLRGHPVVLTFMNATCVQACPLLAQYLNWTTQFLGTKTADVAWVAISVNPQNTADDARGFLAKNRVTMPLRFLLGTHDQLAALWASYHIVVIPEKGDIAHTAGLYV
ncbi:MAG: SCO family protein, partial [Ktedonobacterales bacterium]|nr:SCO family protein [Ktedonobacterales bacterium]